MVCHGKEAQLRKCLITIDGRRRRAGDQQRTCKFRSFQKGCQPAMFICSILTSRIEVWQNQIQEVTNLAMLPKPLRKVTVCLRGDKQSLLGVYVSDQDLTKKTLNHREYVDYSVFESFEDKRVAAAPSLPNGPITQLSPYLTQKPGKPQNHLYVCLSTLLTFAP